MNPHLIYIHKGYSWYLPLTFRNGRRFYGKNIVYIGDRFACIIAKAMGLQAWAIDELMEGANQFKSIYRHHSNLGEEFEVVCIQRWFILREYLRLTSARGGCYIDSDVLLTQNPSSLQRETKHFDLVYTGYSAHFTFINSLESLEAFCEYIMESYRDPSREAVFKDWHRVCVADSGSSGVSDMTLFHWFHQTGRFKVGVFGEIFDEPCIDQSLDCVSGWKTDANGFKMLIWEGRAPFGIKDNGSRVRFAALHHQGKAKRLLGNNAAQLGPCLPGEVYLARCLDIIYRAARRIEQWLTWRLIRRLSDKLCKQQHHSV